jgi:hypothetical protein
MQYNLIANNCRYISFDIAIFYAIYLIVNIFTDITFDTAIFYTQVIAHTLHLILQLSPAI